MFERRSSGGSPRSFLELHADLQQSGPANLDLTGVASGRWAEGVINHSLGRVQVGEGRAGKESVSGEGNRYSADKLVCQLVPVMGKHLGLCARRR
jgi:hypothetical protein